MLNTLCDIIDLVRRNIFYLNKIITILNNLINLSIKEGLTIHGPETEKYFIAIRERDTPPPPAAKMFLDDVDSPARVQHYSNSDNNRHQNRRH